LLFVCISYALQPAVCDRSAWLHLSIFGNNVQGPGAAQRFLRECRDLGFDALEFGCAPFRDEACARMVADIKQVLLPQYDVRCVEVTHSQIETEQFAKKQEQMGSTPSQSNRTLP
jgi:hypothetical protein